MLPILANDLQDYYFQVLTRYFVVVLNRTILPTVHKITLEVFGFSLCRLECGAIEVLDPMAYGTRHEPVGVAIPKGDLVRAEHHDELDVATARVGEVGRFGVFDRFHVRIIP